MLCCGSCDWTVWCRQARACLDELVTTVETWVVDVVLTDACLSLCSRVKELKRAREHETPQKSPLAMWHHSPDSSFFFFRLYPRHFTREMGKKRKNINASTAIITTTAVLPVRLLLHVRQHFFTYLFFPLTWFLVEEWQLLLRDYKLKRVGAGGCRTFASWHFLHFFMDCFVFFEYGERKRTRDMPEEVLSNARTLRDVNWDCCRRSQRIGRPRRNTLGSYCVS